MSVLSNFDEILAALDPQPEGVYVFTCVSEVPAGLTPFAQICEAEGTTIVCTYDQAREAGLSLEHSYARITLGVESALNSVGLTAAITQTIASRSIACNVIAGFHHDHIFVQADRQAEALELLKELSLNAQGWLPVLSDLRDDDMG